MNAYGQGLIEDFSDITPIDAEVPLQEVPHGTSSFHEKYAQLTSDLTDQIAGFAPNIRSVFYAGLLAVSLSLPYSSVYAEGNAAVQVPAIESVDPAATQLNESIKLPEIDTYFLTMLSPDIFSLAEVSKLDGNLTPEDELILESSKSVLPAVFLGRNNSDLSYGTINVIGSTQVAPNLYSNVAVGPAHGFNALYGIYKDGSNKYRQPIKIGIQGTGTFYPADMEFGLDHENRPLDTDVNDEAKITFITSSPLNISNEGEIRLTRSQISTDPEKLKQYPIYISGYPGAAGNLGEEGSSAVNKLIVKTHILDVVMGSDGQVQFIKVVYPEVYSKGMSGGDASIVIDGRVYSFGTHRGHLEGQGIGILVPHEDTFYESNLENMAVPEDIIEVSTTENGVVSFEDLKIQIWNTVDTGEEFDKAAAFINTVFELNPSEIYVEGGNFLLHKNQNGVVRTYRIDFETYKLEALS